MKRAVSMGVIAGLAATILASPVHAAEGDLPARTPTMFSWASVPVSAKGIVSLVCFDFTNMRAILMGDGFFTGQGAPVAMLATSMTNPKGKVISTSFLYHDDLSNLYISAQGGGQGRTEILQRYQPAAIPGISFYTFTFGTAGVLRIAYAAWGSKESCFIAYGSSFATLKTASPSKARLLFPTDFTGGASVSSSNLQVSAVQAYTRRVNGYALALFRPGNGVAKITDPAGKVRFDASNGTGSPQIAEPTKGGWTYSLDAAVRTEGTPVLWVMDLPA